MYASDKKDDTPLNNQLPTPPADDEPTERLKALPILSRGMKRRMDDDEDEAVVKRRKRVAQARFGNSAMPNDKKGIERFDVRIEDPFPAIESGEGRQRLAKRRPTTYQVIGDQQLQ